MEKINIEIAYAEAERQHLEKLSVTKGMTVGKALKLPMQLKNNFANLRIDKAAVGIFSKHVSMDRVLNDGDRIEIYRPLLLDPKEARRKRAQKSNGDGTNQQ